MTPPYSTPRLFVTCPLEGGVGVTLEAAQSHYLARVMRMREGDSVRLFNGRDGEWEAAIETIGKRDVTLRAGTQLRPQPSPENLWLLFAPIKRGRIDWLVEKATELGVASLQPVITRRTVVERLNADRLRAHITEAAEQSERLDAPELREAAVLETLLAAWDPARRLIVGDETGQGAPVADALATLSPSAPLAALVGPEGGFSPEELAMLRRQPYVVPVGLGQRILRADTAALALLAVIQAQKNKLPPPAGGE